MSPRIPKSYPDVNLARNATLHSADADRNKCQRICEAFPGSGGAKIRQIEGGRTAEVLKYAMPITLARC